MFTLYTIGYGGRGVNELLRILKQNGITTLIDVRASANSRIPGYQRKALHQSCADAGIDYQHVRELGNAARFSAEGTPMRLVDEALGMSRLMDSIADQQVAIMCACRQISSCHRQMVADLAQARMSGLQVEHL